MSQHWEKYSVPILLTYGCEDKLENVPYKGNKWVLNPENSFVFLNLRIFKLVP